MTQGLSNRRLAHELNATENAVRKARATGRLPAELFSEAGRCIDLAGARLAWVSNASRPTTEPRPPMGALSIWPADRISVIRTRGHLGICFSAANDDPDQSYIYPVTPATAAALANAITAKLVQQHDDIQETES